MSRYKCVVNLFLRFFFIKIIFEKYISSFPIVHNHGHGQFNEFQPFIKMMGKELVALNFSARITIQRRFHGCMMNKKHNYFEKHDCSTNNVSPNKGGMNIPFGQLF
jgi:hypothetical protein